MAINNWWADDPSQRYWMEITTRAAPGYDLLAPKLDGGGLPQWSYTLVSHVQPGDRVLHYKTNLAGGGAVIGWSEAVTPPSTGTITWQARGTRGRARATAITGPSWFVALGGFNELDAWVRGRDLAAIDHQLFAVRDRLEQSYGRPVYFPFFRYRPGEIRAQQGYLVKFPLELFGLLPNLASASSAAVSEANLVEDEERPGTRAPRGAAARAQDPVLRAAIERRSLDVTKAHYVSLGAVDVDEIGKPYDLALTLDGVERHIEVKGSSLEIDTVELTLKEVLHAEDFQPTDLAVVDGISWKRMRDGSIKTSGGRLRLWRDWAPRDDSLSARKFAYSLPS
ncbi:DUF3883 domain-containing protein [Kribbella soli]|uniref:DUF3883 domain-containing protein n=1 Tax=Kribbella soli TaxID=1124743 RepID=A0A4R0HSQ4_9ACTN|nr:DUF3883 domain-containing protein [Kribbella soli]TCC10899.1 DUF3883 domain-containing protein [Kribbella soli]